MHWRHHPASSRLPLEGPREPFSIRALGLDYLVIVATMWVNYSLSKSSRPDKYPLCDARTTRPHRLKSQHRGSAGCAYEPRAISQTAQQVRWPDRRNLWPDSGMENILRSSSLMRAAYVFEIDCWSQTASQRLRCMLEPGTPRRWTESEGPAELCGSDPPGSDCRRRSSRRTARN